MNEQEKDEFLARHGVSRESAEERARRYGPGDATGKRY
jgi:hypothetical protein